MTVNLVWLFNRGRIRVSQCIPVLLLSLGGCSSLHCCFSYESQSDSGAEFLVLGIGFIKVPGSSQANDVLVVNARSLGLAISNQPGLKASLGYASSSVVSVPADVQAITEVKSCAVGDEEVSVNVLK